MAVLFMYGTVNNCSLLDVIRFKRFVEIRIDVLILTDSGFTIPFCIGRSTEGGAAAAGGPPAEGAPPTGENGEIVGGPRGPQQVAASKRLQQTQAQVDEVGYKVLLMDIEMTKEGIGRR